MREPVENVNETQQERERAANIERSREERERPADIQRAEKSALEWRRIAIQSDAPCPARPSPG
jgi:hypothetical protein